MEVKRNIKCLRKVMRTDCLHETTCGHVLPEDIPLFGVLVMVVESTVAPKSPTY